MKKLQTAFGQSIFGSQWRLLKQKLRLKDQINFDRTSAAWLLTC